MLRHRDLVSVPRYCLIFVIVFLSFIHFCQILCHNIVPLCCLQPGVIAKRLHPQHPIRSDAQNHINHSTTTTSPIRRRPLNIVTTFPWFCRRTNPQKMAADPYPAQHHRISAWHIYAIIQHGVPRLILCYDKYKLGTNLPHIEIPLSSRFRDRDPNKGKDGGAVPSETFMSPRM